MILEINQEALNCVWKFAKQSKVAIIFPPVPLRVVMLVSFISLVGTKRIIGWRILLGLIQVILVYQVYLIIPIAMIV